MPDYRHRLLPSLHRLPREITCGLCELGRASAATELASYLADSFGNASRIDYGTGHETTFVALLYCLVSLMRLRL